MNAYTFYEIGDTFENTNGESYAILGLSEERDKALLSTLTKPIRYIGAKGLCDHYWCHGHYFMADIGAALEWFEEDDSKPKKKEKPCTKILFHFTYETEHIPGVFKNDTDVMAIFAYSFEEARDYLFNIYKDTDWRIIDYNCITVSYFDATKKEDD